LSSSDSPKEIEISEERLQRIGLIILALAVIFAVIGGFTSPLDENGKPVLLLPEVKAFEDYRRSGRDWLEQMVVLDTEIDGVLAGDVSGDLFTQSRQAQQMLQHAVSLAKDIDQAVVPAAAAGIHEQLYSASMAYLEVSRQTMRWVSAPEDAQKEQIITKLDQARKARNALEDNPWLNQP
jgi:hypothetical protein